MTPLHIKGQVNNVRSLDIVGLHNTHKVMARLIKTNAV